jgi:hypothetical protein
MTWTASVSASLVHPVVEMIPIWFTGYQGHESQRSRDVVLMLLLSSSEERAEDV